MKTLLLLIILFFSGLRLNSQVDSGEITHSITPSHLLPLDVMPQIGCWFWRGEELEDEGYKKFIDDISRHSPFSILTTSFRIPIHEISEQHFHDQIKNAHEYAIKKGISIVPDLDLRLARRAFQKKYPDELQEMLILSEVPLSGNKTEIKVFSQDLNDHYTFRTTHYIPLSATVKRVYAYNKSDKGIVEETLEDITHECENVSVKKDSVIMDIPAEKSKKKEFACALVSFTHLTPDVFAPHIIDFQRELVRQYADIPLAGACKDEWGFPPVFHETYNEFWYSEFRAKAYRERTDGRELLKDCLLMYLGIEGLEREREMAINHFRMMSYERNTEIENDFYKTVKNVFGPQAIVATHPTWYPYPGFREYKKNGLDWWAVRRDWAQTDEITPYAVRTALSKKWGSPVWYNMYYSDNVRDYELSVWRDALAGGRMNYHPLYPFEGSVEERDLAIFTKDILKAECRIRLLNFISESPLNCPVAVIFGHTRTMNWAGPRYDDPGLKLAESLWSMGIATDLIPSTEIKYMNPDDEGFISYGRQQYTAVILYEPEYEDPFVADFFKWAANGSTHMFRVGDWTKDFNASDFDGNMALPESMKEGGNNDDLHAEILSIMQKEKIQLHSPATEILEKFGHVTIAPSRTGFTTLIDGTYIHLAGTGKVSGDPIKSKMEIKGFPVSIDAVGMTAVKLDEKGNVLSIAAGGLKDFVTNDMEIHLDKRIDIALKKSRDGNWEGIIQDWEGEVPDQLIEITDKWTRLSIPVPYCP